jgi:Asp-tRNA(Asn)/Glu-tRNA(Gln) amidotransferase A subunit family amidase
VSGEDTTARPASGVSGGGATARPAPRTALATAAAIRSGATTSEEVVTACLELIAEREDELHAWAHLDPEHALAQARQRDEQTRQRDPGETLGPLHGVPVGIKDLIDTADQPTSYGSPIHAGHQPSTDAVAVARLRDAGAVVLGKTVTTEFAVFTPGPTAHPDDPSRTPGGSSSGSAAAVAMGGVPLGLGTQTAGSVVRPASFCGVFGGKPTLGVIPTTGVKACSATLDHVGAFGRDIGDVALALGVMAGDVDRFAPVDLGTRPRVGFCRTPWWDELEVTTREALEAGAERLGRLADVVEVELPAGFDGLVDAQATIMAVEVRRALDAELREHPDLLSDQLRRYLEAAHTSADGYEDALALAERCRAQLAELFAEPRVLLAPSVVGEAPPITTTGDPLLCRAWTLLGTPTISVPGLTGPSGLPLGAQVIAAPGADAAALAGAALAAVALEGSVTASHVRLGNGRSRDARAAGPTGRGPVDGGPAGADGPGGGRPTPA